MFAGGYNNVGSAKDDFKNYQRDIRAYINGSDAQMFINYFKSKAEIWPGFYFDYEVDGDGHLCRVFWADPMCRKNYSLYGDMISFDSTYGSNRYNMIFAPFTGIDNHKKCITFGASLIANETTESFEWVFKNFIKTMDNNMPKCMVTDQNGAMKKAIDNIFDNTKTKHRYCTWHITRKFLEKLGKNYPRETEFLKAIHECIWDPYPEQSEFEAKWKEIMTEFDLLGNEWFTNMFKIRNMWLPMYFMELFLGGIMRTTSRSESENSFFGRFTHTYLTLAQFNMNYVNAIENQRHSPGKEDNDCRNAEFPLKTTLQIEKDGAKQYTKNLFYEFQLEVYIGSNMCGLESLERTNNLEIYIITQKDVARKFRVSYISVEHETSCSCKRFNRFGIPCRHMIWVWKNKMLDAIPTQYVIHRWIKYAAQKQIFYMQGNILGECSSTVNKKRKLSELWSEIYTCVGLVEGDDASLEELVENLKELRKGLESKVSVNKDMSPTKRKEKEIEMLIGLPKPAEILIKEPKLSRNKGSGIHITNSSKTLKSKREIACEKIKKRLRKCAGCNKNGHDKRNCQEYKEKIAKLDTQLP